MLRTRGTRLAAMGGALLRAAGANLAASLAMLLVLARATLAGGAPEARLAYVAAHREAVVAGWSLWVGATMALYVSWMAATGVWLMTVRVGPRPPAAPGRGG